MTTKPANVRRKQDGRFAKGHSGNPAGKLPGTRHRATLAAEALLDGEGEALTRKAIEMALEGDGVALRLCLDRLLPPRKDRPLRIDLPRLESSADISKALAVLAQAVAEGELTPREANAIGNLLEGHRRAIETTELEARIAVLEEAQG
jgi:hypothetical protein